MSKDLEMNGRGCSSKREEREQMIRNRRSQSGKLMNANQCGFLNCNWGIPINELALGKERRKTAMFRVVCVAMGQGVAFGGNGAHLGEQEDYNDACPRQQSPSCWPIECSAWRRTIHGTRRFELFHCKCFEETIAVSRKVGEP